MKFRKSIKIAKGVKVNIGKKGLSSVSIGGNGATLNVGGKGVKATTGIPGTGISETVNLTNNNANIKSQVSQQANDPASPKRTVGFFLGAGILLMPYIFSWFLLPKGYSFTARLISFGWLGFLLYIVISGSNP